MARKGILYEQVIDAISALQTNKQKVTVRAIHAVTGGSMSTVLKHYRRWQSEQLGQTSDATEISPQLTEALHNELRNYARRSLLVMETRLSTNNQKLQEIESAYKEARCYITDLEKALQENEQSSSPKMAEMEAQCKQALQSKAHAEEQLYQARQHAVLMENRLAEVDTRLGVLNQELNTAREQIRKSSAQVEDLEQRLEEADARAQRAEAQLQELLPREKSRQQRNNTPPPKTPSAKPAAEEQQEAFEF
jgi:chromosome segregation ATPase